MHAKSAVPGQAHGTADYINLLIIKQFHPPRLTNQEDRTEFREYGEYKCHTQIYVFLSLLTTLGIPSLRSGIPGWGSCKAWNAAVGPSGQLAVFA